MADTNKPSSCTTTVQGNVLVKGILREEPGQRRTTGQGPCLEQLDGTGGALLVEGLPHGPTLQSRWPRPRWWPLAKWEARLLAPRRMLPQRLHLRLFPPVGLQACRGGWCLPSAVYSGDGVTQAIHFLKLSHAAVLSSLINPGTWVPEELRRAGLVWQFSGWCSSKPIHSAMPNSGAGTLVSLLLRLALTWSWTGPHMQEKELSRHCEALSGIPGHLPLPPVPGAPTSQL